MGIFVGLGGVDSDQHKRQESTNVSADNRGGSASIRGVRGARVTNQQVRGGQNSRILQANGRGSCSQLTRGRRGGCASAVQETRGRRGTTRGRQGTNRGRPLASAQAVEAIQENCAAGIQNHVFTLDGVNEEAFRDYDNYLEEVESEIPNIDENPIEVEHEGGVICRLV